MRPFQSVMAGSSTMNIPKSPLLGILAKLVYLSGVPSSPNAASVLRGILPLKSHLLALLFGLVLSPTLARSEVVLNEIMANNVSTVANGSDYPDWIELYNTVASTVNIGGMSLTNIGSSSPKFVFPANTFLDPNGFLVVWCDSASPSPGFRFHTGFKLSSGGESVALYAADGFTRLDYLDFGLQLPDLTIGRVPNGTGTWVLNVPTPAQANEARGLGLHSSLRMNEWMATNSMGDDWIELYNLSTNPVALAGLVLTDKLSAVPSNRAITNLSFIGAEDFLQLFASSLRKKDANHLDFKLSHTSGETVTLYDVDRSTLLDRISFGAGVLSKDASQGRLPDGGGTIVLFPAGKTTPGASNFLPLTNVVINEVLSHTDPPLEDAIELHNPTSLAVDISDWWISNSKDNPKKFRVPAGTTIPAGGYKVFYEQGFNPDFTGNSPSFTLNSAHGDFVYLLTGNPAGELTGFRRSVNFGAAENGVSFGRFITVSNGVEFVAMSQRSFGVDTLPFTLGEFRSGTGRTNVYPKIGPMIIHEIMYHPPDAQATNDNTIDEYIELYNMSGANVPLYDPIVTTNTWKLNDAVTFEFPRFVTVPAGGFILVVNFSPTNVVQREAFCAKYNVPGGACVPNVTLFGPYRGKLKNSGASVELYKPDPPQGPPHPDAGFVPYILVDKVEYSDSAPWPDQPDGHGTSLQRRKPEDYANDVVNWTFGPPTPGGQVLKVISAQRANGSYLLKFMGLAGSSYTVEYQNSLGAGTWTKLVDLPPQLTTGLREAADSAIGSSSKRFYRIVTPSTP